MHDQLGAAQEGSAFEFEGRWNEYLPVALTNLLLTVVTLGIYRFWAIARERRYLWSRTRFIGEPLEWTGTGGEMFRGFLVAVALVLPFLIFIQFGFQAMVLRGQTAEAVAILILLYFGLLYLVGLATFLALRYRLSRTLWRGIRGGSNDPGWRYAWSSLWKQLIGFLAFGLLIPWSMTRLWGERWSAMSYGDLRFHADPGSKGLLGRWLLIYSVPLIFVALAIALAFAGSAAGAQLPDASGEPGRMVAIALAAIAIFYLVIPLAALLYFAKYFRTVIGATRLGDIEFRFTASSKDWAGLIFGTLGLIVVTLGGAMLFLAYRNWSFFIRHLEAIGDVDPARITQSTTRIGRDAEGLAAMFDVGAI